MNHAAGSAASPLASDSGRGADSGRGPDPGRSTDPGRPHAERVWEQRRALGRRLAALRSRSGFSQWEFAPLTGYSRSTLSDAELGRHRLRREFWERCDGALMSDGVLTAAYDRIEAVATAVRRTARSQAQAAREEQASRRLQALLPAPSAEGLGADGADAVGSVSSAAAPAVVAGDVAPGGVAPDGDAPGGIAAGGIAPGGIAPGGTAANGIVWGRADPLAPLGLAPAAAGPPAPRAAPDGPAPGVPAPGVPAPGVPAPDGPAPDGPAPDVPAPVDSPRAGSVPPGPASSGAAAHPGAAGQPHGETIQPQGEGAHSPLAVMEQCPHCHQPVTVIIVAAAPPAAGSSAG